MSHSEECGFIFLKVANSRQTVKDHYATIVPGLARKFAESAWLVLVFALHDSFHQVDMQIVERAMPERRLTHRLYPISGVFLGDL